jgi:hypothetical protein
MLLDVKKLFVGAISRPTPGWLRFAACGVCVAAILVVLAKQYSPEYGFTGMLRYGEKFNVHALDKAKQAPRKIFPGLGFDGQFYANLALDPTLTNKKMAAAMDLPQYRSRRIFLPLCAFLAGHGNPASTVNAYAVCNFVFWIFLCILVFVKINPYSLQGYACVLIIVFTSGVVGSALLALTDMPATALLFAALVFPLLWPLFLSCAVLTRETTLFFTPVFLLMEILSKKKLPWIFLKTALAFTPIILWYGYCMWRIPEPVFIEKVYGLPFLAMLHRLGSIVYHWPAAFCLYQVRYFLTAISLTAQCAYFAIRPRPKDPLWLTGAIGSVSFALMGHISWMEFSWILRYSLPMTFAFNLLLSKEDPPRFLKWFFVGNIGCLYV